MFYPLKADDRNTKSILSVNIEK